MWSWQISVLRGKGSSKSNTSTIHSWDKIFCVLIRRYSRKVKIACGKLLRCGLIRLKTFSKTLQKWSGNWKIIDIITKAGMIRNHYARKVFFLSKKEKNVYRMWKQGPITLGTQLCWINFGSQSIWLKNKKIRKLSNHRKAVTMK